MARSDAEPDPAKRFELLRQAEQMLLDEAPFIPLYQYADGEMFDATRLEGVEMNVRNMTALKWIRRK
jgi:oligopeptide transport system substrate-binding protein